LQAVATGGDGGEQTVERVEVLAHVGQVALFLVAHGDHEMHVGINGQALEPGIGELQDGSGIARAIGGIDFLAVGVGFPGGRIVFFLGGGVAQLGEVLAVSAGRQVRANAGAGREGHQEERECKQSFHS